MRSDARRSGARRNPALGVAHASRPRVAGAVLALAASLAGCVAPEPPAPPPIAHPAAAATPAPSNVQYEAAPVPNRRMGPYVGDSVIRVAH